MLPPIGIATALIPTLIRLISGDKTNTLAAEVKGHITSHNFVSPRKRLHIRCSLGSTQGSTGRLTLAQSKEAGMRQTDLSPELELPEFSYGSVWLVGAGDGDPRHLSPLAVHALGTADAVIHDPAVPREIFELMKPSHYREAGSPYSAIGRAVRLAQEGWRVAHLVEGNTIGRAIQCAARCAEQEIPFRVVPGAGEAVAREAPLGLLLVSKSAPLGGADHRSSLVLVVASPQTEAAPNTERRLPPLGFSMSGLAG
jgi:Tetrapyrrole (Corrin/Porphyrin) Methylases